MRKDLKIKNNTFVHCKTEELAEQVLEIAHYLGYNCFTRSNVWNIMKEGTCYNLNKGTYTDVSLLGENHKVISADEFLKLHKELEENFYMVCIDGEKLPAIRYKSKDRAKKEAKRFANKLNEKVFILKSDLTVIPDEINIKVNSFETAFEYLGCKSNDCMCDITAKQEKAVVAMYKLITIAEAWNKGDNFVPNLNCDNFPWFKYNNGKLICVDADNEDDSILYSHISPKLSFKTQERANQFGIQFIDLWSDFLAIN